MSGTGLAALRGRRILVAEDEYFIADEIAGALEGAGVEVVGPAATVGEATHLAMVERRLDGAVLDVNLRREMIWPVLDALASRGVPVVLATGYDAGVVPAAYAHLPRCEKPVPAGDILRVLAKQLTAAG
ncbi:response regulator [Roseomonas indoligenes]|uniref:Response regulator n=1 Tax=Roseomonas indoligenes TaxID=2820811 RepID=A0A940MZI6_9PROT|nr:response regulator [Pararoseomonas indoligenes]MBP0496234.1 response regulator [Pararoseomonas indoligenes]